MLQIHDAVPGAAHTKRGGMTRRLMNGLVLPAFLLGVCLEARAVPSFTRQTGLQCAVCHSNPPELTAFGRKFKLEGYTLTAKRADTTIEDKDLKIGRYLPISTFATY